MKRSLAFLPLLPIGIATATNLLPSTTPTALANPDSANLDSPPSANLDSPPNVLQDSPIWLARTGGTDEQTVCVLLLNEQLDATPLQYAPGNAGGSDGVRAGTAVFRRLAEAVQRMQGDEPGIKLCRRSLSATDPALWSPRLCRRWRPWTPPHASDRRGRADADRDRRPNAMTRNSPPLAPALLRRILDRTAAHQLAPFLLLLRLVSRQWRRQADRAIRRLFHAEDVHALLRVFDPLAYPLATAQVLLAAILSSIPPDRAASPLLLPAYGGDAGAVYVENRRGRTGLALATALCRHHCQPLRAKLTRLVERNGRLSGEIARFLWHLHEQQGGRTVAWGEPDSPPQWGIRSTGAVICILAWLLLPTYLGSLQQDGLAAVLVRLAVLGVFLTSIVMPVLDAELASNAGPKHQSKGRVADPARE